MISHWIEAIGLNLFQRIDPEISHNLALTGLRCGVIPLPGLVTSSRLRTNFAGIQLPNPIGIAAGFDKNSVVLKKLVDSGVGFVEVGAVTPRPQYGNQRPRLFRLTEDQAIINRLGFNNDGMEKILQRLKHRPLCAIVGLNLGSNRDTVDKVSDFIKVMEHCSPYVDYVTVNISSPNTKNLRDLQHKDALSVVLDRMIKARELLPYHIPIFIKIAPDLSPVALKDIVNVCLDKNVNGIIATNTTTARDNLKSRYRHEEGGLSGLPLSIKSTRIIAALSKMTDGCIPLMGVGGIFTAEDAYDKIRAGATAVQLYTGLVYSGLSQGAKIAKELDMLLERDGYENVADAVGTCVEDWM